MKSVVMASDKNKLQAREDVLAGFVRNIKSNQTVKEIILTKKHAPIVYYPSGNVETLDFYLKPIYY